MIRKPLIFLRRSVQVLSTLFFIFVLWSATYPLTGSVSPRIFFLTDPLLMGAAAVSTRTMVDGLIWSGIMLALALILGRYFCGWICPLGSSIDAVGSLGRRVILSAKAGRSARWGKFAALAIFVVLAVAGFQWAWFLDPIALAGRFVSLNMIPAATGALDAGFVFLIRDLNFRGPLLECYSALKESFLGVKISFFVHSATTLIAVAAIVGASALVPRLWCRALCPLGGLYALFSRFSLLSRKVNHCSSCARCVSFCRTGAIRPDLSYDKSECVLCMDCVESCPESATRFDFLGKKEETNNTCKTKRGHKVSRRTFLTLIAAFLFSFRGSLAEAFQKGPRKALVIRPPAALPEEEFVDRCVRCGNCMKVCITNGLQPVTLEAGLDALWTPQLVSQVGYCQYRCTLCGQTCPTGAIKELTLEEKMRTRLGIAVIWQEVCLPWAEGKQCIVCQEHCPTGDKAIKLVDTVVDGVVVARPYVDADLCIGCGICENKCPVRPGRAITVEPL